MKTSSEVNTGNSKIRQLCLRSTSEPIYEVCDSRVT